jgi:hypothetical protein
MAGKGVWIWVSVGLASVVFILTDVQGARQEQAHPQDAASVPTTIHKIPRGPHSKSTTAPDSWEGGGRGQPHKSNTAPDSWVGGGGGKPPKSNTPPDDWQNTQGGQGSSGSGKTKGSHADDWMSTDVSTSKSTRPSSAPHHKAPKPVQARAPK